MDKVITGRYPDTVKDAVLMGLARDFCDGADAWDAMDWADGTDADEETESEEE